MVFVKAGYVKEIWRYVTEVYRTPDLMYDLEYMTLFDRFYPLYSSIVQFTSWNRVLGLGFGGDYYEFVNIFPAQSHAAMKAIKPSLSYYNALTPKIILYLGVLGIAGLIWSSVKALRCKNPMIKIAMLNILITSLWGIANFSLPYFWLWFALILNQQRQSTHA